MSELVSKYDNSETLNVVVEEDKFLGSRTGKYEEVVQQTKYINYLKAMADIEKDESKVKVGGKEIAIKSLVPQMTDFEVQKLQVIALVNSLGTSDPLVRKMMADFNTNSIYELAESYANYVLGRESADKLYNIINGTDSKGTASIYDQLIDPKTRDEAKKTINTGAYGTFRRGREGGNGGSAPTA